jgi:ABC-2 type transport system permease protein
MFDIEKEPLLVQQKDIKEQNTLEIDYKGKKYKKVIQSELDVTNLLIKVLSNRNYKVYYTTGHSEADLFSAEKKGMSLLKGQIENSQYHLLPLDLMRVNTVPKDADLLLILSPQSDLLKEELKILGKYIGRGGSTFSLMSPHFSDSPLTNWTTLYKKIGVKRINGLVLDKLSSTLGLDPSIVAISKLNSHEITKGITSRLVMPLNVILKSQAHDEYIINSLMQSSLFPASWGETNLKSLESGKVFYNKDDFKGPLDIGLIISSKTTGAIHTLFASSMWLTNQYQSQSSHFNLAMNSISYSLGDNSLVTLNRPSLSKDPILLSNSELSLIFYFSVLFLPFLFFGMGIYFYHKRAKG